MNPVRDQRATLRCLRHGATVANLLGLRCSGDLDLPLAEVGRTQAVEAARRAWLHSAADASFETVRPLRPLQGIGITGAWVVGRALLGWRALPHRREGGGFAG